MNQAQKDVLQRIVSTTVLQFIRQPLQRRRLGGCRSGILPLLRQRDAFAAVGGTPALLSFTK
jgi:hypothetical protein